MDTPPTPSENSTPAGKSHACVLCQQRKVKCDRQSPCAACTKSRVECVYRDPAPPRRRKRRTPEDLLLARLRRYEELLKNAGVKVDNVPNAADLAESANEDRDQQSPIGQTITGTSSHDQTSQNEPKRQQAFAASDQVEGKPVYTGKLIVEEGRTRYLENYMWTKVSEENGSVPMPEEEEIEDIPHWIAFGFKPSDTADDILLGDPTKKDLRNIHPTPLQIFELWQTFLANINPLTHIVHAPTLQDSLYKACEDMSRISRGLEALMFAMYCSTVNSMSDQECQSMLGEPRDLVLMRFIYGCRQALINSLWLRTSEMMVLQAYTLFLLAVRPMYDPRTLWALSGVAVRIAQRIGLHRDGTFLRLGPFETEMRRRLWWQVIVLDGRNAELAGAGFSIQTKMPDTKVPLNVNDEDIYPGMTEPPKEHTGATEMMFCLLRYEFGQFFKQFMETKAPPKSGFGGIMQSLTNDQLSVAERDQTIDRLQEIIENKFLRFCDPLNRTHFIAAAVARTALTVMRFKVHLPRRTHGRDEQKLSSEEMDMLFATSIKLLEYDNLGLSTKSAQGFLWHIRSHFSWDSFVFLLSELRRRTIGPQVEKAWKAVEECYLNHPEFLSRVSPLYASIATLAEKAWLVRQGELARRQNVPVHSVPPPAFIAALQERKAKPGSISQVEQESGSYLGNDALISGTYPVDKPETYLITPEMDISPIDWAAWDGMIEDFESHSGISSGIY